MKSKRHKDLLSANFRAMGSHIQLWLEGDEPTARVAFRSAQGLFEGVERVLSRFNPASELSRLNARPGEWVGVSPLMWHVLGRALAMAEQTGGLFDPTVLPALEAAGYTRDFNDIKQHGADDTLRPEAALVGRWAEVQTNPRTQEIYLPQGVKIDLGGIAKGWTAERVALQLGHYGPCLVEAGGDVVARDTPTGEPGWPVGLPAPSSDPEVDPKDLLIFWLRSGSVATSGVDWRRWEVHGRTAHHLIDPRRGQPADTDLITATVLAADASHAEAWATASLILGTEQAQVELEKRGIAGALIGADGQLALTAALEPYLAWRQAA